MPDEIVRIRVMGPPEAVWMPRSCSISMVVSSDQLVADLQAHMEGEVRDVSPPYVNRGQGGGVRRYLTALVPVRGKGARR